MSGTTPRDQGRTAEATGGTGEPIGPRGTPPTGPSGGAAYVPDEAPLAPSAAGFTVGRLLGSGGSASVWLVQDEGGGRFALKVPHADPGRGTVVSGTSRGAAPDGAESPAGDASDPAARGTTAAAPASGRRNPTPGPAPHVQPPRRHGRRAAATATSSSGPPLQAPSVPVPPAPAGSVAGSAHPSGSAAEDMALEMRLLRRFDHEHLLRIHRTVATDRGPALLLEFAAGGSLLGLLTARGPLPIAEVVTALVPIAQALDYLHGSGAVHGDVSPANILFTQEGKPLLADFGTGRLLGAPDRAAPGTPGFVDPTRGAAYDPGADVFALAAVAWFALTGRIPGPEQQRPPLALIVPDVPPPLVQLIEDGLSADRRHRPGADDFARVLLASAAPDPVDLVPAVHASVRPELLTRRSGSPRAPSKPAWQRLRLQRWGPGRSRQAPSARSSDSSRDSATVGRDDTARRRLALLSGALALLLLSAGIALTMGGVSGPADPDRLTAGSSSSTSANSSSPAPASSPRPVVGTTGRAGPGAAQTGGAGESASRGGGGAEALDAGSAGGGPGEPGTDDGPGDPTRALVGLAALRAAAFATADAEILRRVDVAGSPAMTADQDAVEALATSDRHLPDLTIAIRDAALLEPAEQGALPVLPGVPYADAAPADTDVALVRATAALSAYTEESTDRASSLPPPALMAASRQDLVFVLWNDGTSTDGWLIHSVIEAPD